MGHELLGHLVRERRIKAATDVDRHQFLVLAPGVGVRFRALTGEFSLFGVGLGLDRGLYLPAAIDIAPATRPATPATTTLLCVAWAAAIPSTRLAVDDDAVVRVQPAARSQPIRPVRCRSCRCLAMPAVSVMRGQRSPTCHRLCGGWTAQVPPWDNTPTASSGGDSTPQNVHKTHPMRVVEPRHPLIPLQLCSLIPILVIICNNHLPRGIIRAPYRPSDPRKPNHHC